MIALGYKKTLNCRHSGIHQAAWEYIVSVGVFASQLDNVLKYPQLH